MIKIDLSNLNLIIIIIMSSVLLSWDNSYMPFNQMDNLTNFTVFMNEEIHYLNNYADSDNFLKCVIKPIKPDLGLTFNIKVDNIEKIFPDTYSDNLILPLSTHNQNSINNKIKNNFQKLFNFTESGGHNKSLNSNNIIVMMENYGKPLYTINRPNKIDLSQFNIEKFSCINDDFVKLKFKKSLRNEILPIDVKIRLFKDNLSQTYNSPINRQLLNQYITNSKDVNRSIYLNCEVEYLKINKTVYVYHNIYLKQIDVLYK